MRRLGTVRGGVVVFDGGPALAEGAKVRVEVVEEEAGPATLAERFASVIGIVEGLPDDLAENHDHYLHGQPKR